MLCCAVLPQPTCGQTHHASSCIATATRCGVSAVHVATALHAMQGLIASKLVATARAAAQAAGTSDSQSQLLHQLSHAAQLLTSSASGLPAPFDLRDNNTLPQLLQQQAGMSQAASVSGVQGNGGGAGSGGEIQASTLADKDSPLVSDSLHQRQQPVLLSQRDRPDPSDPASQSQQQQQQQQEITVSVVPDNTLGSVFDVTTGEVTGVEAEQDTAAKAAYRQWSHSFEARMVSVQ